MVKSTQDDRYLKEDDTSRKIIEIKGHLIEKLSKSKS
jgi:hypothetical protein